MEELSSAAPRELPAPRQKIGKFLWFALVGVLLILVAEVAALWYAKKKRVTRFQSSYPGQRPSQQVMPAPPRYWKPWEPSEVSAYQNPQYGNIMTVLAKIEEIIDSTNVRAVTKDGQHLVFRLTPSTAYFTRQELVDKTPVDRQEDQPFSLAKDQVVLFEWLNQENKEPSSPIEVWRVMRFLKQE